jgi:hypothetical protein
MLKTFPSETPAPFWNFWSQDLISLIDIGIDVFQLLRYNGNFNFIRVNRTDGLALIDIKMNNTELTYCWSLGLVMFRLYGSTIPRMH